MTIQWFEGFDLYPLSTATDFSGSFWNDLYSGVAGGRSAQVDAARNGNAGLRVSSVISTAQDTTRPCTNGASRTTFGAAIQQNISYGTGSRDLPACGFIGSNGRLMIAYDETQSIAVYRNGSLVGRSSSTFNIGTYNYCEVEVTHATSGNVTVTLWVNNTMEFQDSIAFIGTISAFVIGSLTGSGLYGVSGTSTYFDDIYIADDQDRLGDSAVIVQMPDANTTPQDWTVTGAASQWEALANVPFNDSEYITTPTQFDQSQFELEAPPPDIFQVHAVAHQYRGQKDDVQDARVQGAVILPGGGPDVNTGADNTFVQQWNYFIDIFETNAAGGGGAWSPADLNTIELRYERTL